MCVCTCLAVLMFMRVLGIERECKSNPTICTIEILCVCACVCVCVCVCMILSSNILVETNRAKII